jgi:predicted lipid-binding transport protein (Tim44 family)
MPDAARRPVEGVAEPTSCPPATVSTGARPASPSRDPQSPVGQALMRIAASIRSFEPNAFLDGAEGAFRMIVDAFAQGDRQTLRALLSDDTYAGFEQVSGRPRG